MFKEKETEAQRSNGRALGTRTPGPGSPERASPTLTPTQGTQLGWGHLGRKSPGPAFPGQGRSRLTQQSRVFPPGACGLLFPFPPEKPGASLWGPSPWTGVCGLQPTVRTEDPQQQRYHSVVIPEEDESRSGDHPWPMGSWDGQSFSLGHQAFSAQRRAEKRQLLLRTGKAEGAG